MSTMTKYRGRKGLHHVIGLSISYERDDLLARGLGLEHLREMLNRLARPLLRNGANLAYGGHWREADDNFTYELLRLISAEQEDTSYDGAEANLAIGRLFNHLAWPHYLSVTPRIEAQWIRCCRIVRLSQELAGILPDARVDDAQAFASSDKTMLNSAITLSAMRRLSMSGLSVVTPGLPSTDSVPPVSARVLLGGRLRQWSGFLPGLFEEALVTLQAGRPLYILGGFGGAAGALAQALIGPKGSRPRELDFAWLQAENPKVKQLADLANAAPLPSNIMATAPSLDALYEKVEVARQGLAVGLNTGLSDDETRELLTTRDMRRAVHLVITGLQSKVGIEQRAS
jgi:hypothetical protein